MTSDGEDTSATGAPEPEQMWESARVQEIVAAIKRGDIEGAEKIRAHMLREGDFVPPPEVDMDELTRAMLLFRRSGEANAAGRPEEGRALMDQVVVTSSATTLVMVLASSLLYVGQEQGWLSEHDHDELAAMTSHMGPEMAVLVRAIKRGQPADAQEEGQER
jgi:hypothetical protein